MTGIKAVIFDLDNTLVSRKLAFRSFAEDFVHEHLAAMAAPDSLERMIAYMIRTDNNGYCVRRDFYSDLIEKWRLGSVTARQLTDAHPSVFPKYTTLDTDTPEVLRVLAPKYKLGIITNGSSASQNGKIDFVGLRDKFQAVTVSDDVGVGKPDRRIFEISCAELDVKPEEAVYIGDSYEKDVQGAVNAGLRAVWYAGEQENIYRYEPAVRRLADVIAIVEREIFDETPTC